MSDSLQNKNRKTVERKPSRHKTMTIVAHLDEFRTRLVRCCTVVLIFTFVTYVFSLDAIVWLKSEFCPELEKLIFTRPLELFIIRIKVSIYLALFLSIPYVSYELWKFVTPALLKKERKNVIVFAATSSIFFILGGVFSLFVVLPTALRFALGMGSEEIVPMITVESVLSLTALLILGFGIMFQLPIVVFILTAYKFVSIEKFTKFRPYIICSIFIVSALLTPPDVVSMLAMGLPTLLLFEISLLAARLFLRRSSKQEATEKSITEKADLNDAL